MLLNLTENPHHRILILMLKQITGIFLCALTLLAFQVQAASFHSVCLTPEIDCCSTEPGSCCDSAPSDCCIELPDQGLLYPVPDEFQLSEAAYLGDQEKPETAVEGLFADVAFRSVHAGPDPPSPAGRELLPLVQSFLI